jgi:beta-glucosidase
MPPPDITGIPAAVAAAKAADVAVLFLGADQTTEAENFDRETLGLVGAQEQLLSAVTVSRL